MLLIEKNEFLFLCVVDSFLFFRIKGKDGEKSIEQKKKNNHLIRVDLSPVINRNRYKNKTKRKEK